MLFSLRMTSSNQSPRRVALSVSVSLCLVSSLRAQEPPCLQRTVVANVLTEAGQPVADVPASSFRGTFRGKPVRVLSATRDLGPRRVVVLLDASGSMLDGGAKWPLARRAVGDILNALPAKNQITLLVFAAKVDAVVGFSEGRQAIADKIAALEAGRKAFPKGSRNTALLDAMLQGLSLLQPAQQGDVIYLISDGGDNASRAEPDKLERELLATGVRLFALGFVDPSGNRSRTRDELIGSSLLHDFAEDTGGALLILEGYSFEGKREAELNLSLRRLYSQMTEFYRLEVALAEPIDKPGRWKLKLVDDDGKEVKPWHPAYQSVLLPCNPPTAKRKENN